MIFYGFLSNKKNRLLLIYLISQYVFINKKLPKPIEFLSELIYLDLSNTNIKRFPIVITKLKNLKEIHVNSDFPLGSVPQSIKNIVIRKKSMELE